MSSLQRREERDEERGRRKPARRTVGCAYETLWRHSRLRCAADPSPFNGRMSPGFVPGSPDLRHAARTLLSRERGRNRAGVCGFAALPGLCSSAVDGLLRDGE